MRITGQMHFAKALAQLRGRGVEPSGMTPDELYALAEACRRCADPFGAEGLELLDAPAAVLRGVEFRPLTVGASVWLDEFAGRWWKDDDSRYFWALVYALTHAHDRDAFTPLVTESAARRAIMRMALRFAFGRKALERAVDAALGTRDDAPAETDGSARADWSALVARLEAASGIPRGDWLWGCAATYTMRAYCELHRMAAAHAGEGAGPSPKDALDDAMSALARAKAAIVRRLAGSGKGEDQGEDADGGRDDGKADGEVADGAAAGGRPAAAVVGGEQAAGEPHEEGVVGGVGGGVVKHSAEDYTKSAEANQWTMR